jgi:hypothetical protein
MVFDWMNKAIQRKYGSSKCLTSAERTLFGRLTSAVNVIVAERERQRTVASNLVSREFQYQRARKNLILAKRFDELSVESEGSKLYERIIPFVIEQWQWLLVAIAVGSIAVLIVSKAISLQMQY